MRVGRHSRERVGLAFGIGLSGCGQAWVACLLMSGDNVSRLRLRPPSRSSWIELPGSLWGRARMIRSPRCWIVIRAPASLWITRVPWLCCGRRVWMSRSLYWPAGCWGQPCSSFSTKIVDRQDRSSLVRRLTAAQPSHGLGRSRLTRPSPVITGAEEAAVVDAARIIPSTESGVSAATQPGCPCRATSMCSDTLIIPHNRMNLGMPDRHPGPASGCGGCFI